MFVRKVEVSAVVEYIAQLFVFAVVGFSKCKSLYLHEREKCYERQIYAFNPHKTVQKFVTRTLKYLKILCSKCLVTLMNSFQSWGLSYALGDKSAEYVFGFMKLM